MYEYNAAVMYVVDGDTFDLDIDLGFKMHIHDIRCRLLHTDTPEMKGSDRDYGHLVTQYVRQLIEGKQVRITSEKDDRVGKDVYGRWLVNIYLEDGTTLSDHLSQLGVNKLCENYSTENCMKLKSLILDRS